MANTDTASAAILAPGQASASSANNSKNAKLDSKFSPDHAEQKSKQEKTKAKIKTGFKPDHLEAEKELHRNEGETEQVEKKEQSSAASEEKTQQRQSWKQAKRMVKQAENISSWTAFGVNLLGAAFVGLKEVPENIKTVIEKSVNSILNVSFSFYGLSGVLNGIGKKNVAMVAGFAMEMFMPWLGDIKKTYLLRGIGTGLDQLWMPVDQHSPEYIDGIFPDWNTGLKQIGKVVKKLSKDILKNPITGLFTKDKEGHRIVFSSAGQIASTLGYFATGSEKFWGELRDFAGSFFDVSMLFEKDTSRKTAGVFFLLESIFDFSARKFKESSRIALNMLSHACGRLACMIYKDSDPSTKNDHKPELSPNTEMALAA